MVLTLYSLFQWRYCIRIENLGQETVQLRERHWRIFSLAGTLETVRGRGVAGQVRFDGDRQGRQNAFQKFENFSLYICKFKREFVERRTTL